MVASRVKLVLGGALLAIALLMASLVAASGSADAATTTVKKTFSNQGQVLIPADAVPADCNNVGPAGIAAPYPSQRNASFPRGSHIKDVNLVLKNYSHVFPADVDVLLAHKGVNRTVMSDVGGGSPGISNITLKLDDEAATHLDDFYPPASGSFKPTNVDGIASDDFPAPAPVQDQRSALRGFDGLNPSGTWNLFVQDDSPDDCGVLVGGWSVTITAAVPS